VTRPSVPAIALLPLRVFFGLTFLWAGIDKLLDPTFLDPTAATSLHAQLVEYARQSPLGELIRASLPAANAIGFLIALGEVAIGIGALTGLAFRLAAIGGAALSFLFWLTASWPTHPYYFGADLPYLFGWVALAIAGTGDLFVPGWVRPPEVTAGAPRPTTTPRTAPKRSAGSRRLPSKASAPRVASWAATPASTRTDRRSGASPEVPESPARRIVIEAGLLAVLAAVVASITGPLRGLGVTSEPTAAPAATPTPVPAGTSTPAPTSVAGAPSPATGDLAIARVSDVTQAGSAAFTVPLDAPAPLPAGDPGIVVKLGDGSFVGYDAVCTHAGCTVQYDPTDAIIFCPCHGAEFDPAHDAAVLGGPTRQPLAKLPLAIDTTTGTISLSTS
jgi:thiosulfate dehydrogenase [quinone] large subunit